MDTLQRRILQHQCKHLPTSSAESIPTSATGSACIRRFSAAGAITIGAQRVREKWELQILPEATVNTVPKTTALIIIDVQEGIDHPKHGRRNNPDAETNMARLLDAWRRTGRPIIHVQH